MKFELRCLKQQCKLYKHKKIDKQDYSLVGKLQITIPKYKTPTKKTDFEKKN